MNLNFQSFSMNTRYQIYGLLPIWYYDINKQEIAHGCLNKRYSSFKIIRELNRAGPISMPVEGLTPMLIDPDEILDVIASGAGNLIFADKISTWLSESR